MSGDLAHSLDAVTASSSGRPILLSVGVDGLEVRTGRGELLSATAAEVLVALGGEEPSWLRLVEGLTAAYAVWPHLADLIQIADVLGRRQADRAPVARSSDEPLLLSALAGAGVAQVVQNPRCSRRAWDLLVGHRDATVGDKARRLADTLPSALGNHPDPDVRERVARNPACDPVVLDHLADDRDPAVRRTAGANPMTPGRSLAKLCRDPEPTVARAALANTATPRAALIAGRTARDPLARAAVAGNSALAPAAARRLILDPSPHVHHALARRLDLTPTSLSWLERYARHDPYRDYRQALWLLTHNPGSPARLRRRIQRISAGFDAHVAESERSTWRSGAILLGQAILITLGIILLAVGLSPPAHVGSGAPQIVSGSVFVLLAVGAAVRYRVRRARLQTLWQPPRRPGLAVIGILLFGCLVISLSSVALGAIVFGFVVIGTLLLYRTYQFVPQSLAFGRASVRAARGSPPVGSARPGWKRAPRIVIVGIGLLVACAHFASPSGNGVCECSVPVTQRLTAELARPVTPASFRYVSRDARLYLDSLGQQAAILEGVAQRHPLRPSQSLALTRMERTYQTLQQGDTSPGEMTRLAPMIIQELQQLPSASGG